MPSPKPEPNDKGHARPSGEKESLLDGLLRKEKKGKGGFSEIILTFKDNEREHNANTEARYCKERELLVVLLNYLLLI